MKEVLDMKYLIMTELQILVPEDIPVLELMHFSERATIRRKERTEAIKKNQIFIG